MVSQRYDRSKLLTRVKCPSKIPTKNQWQRAVDGGWADRIRSVQDEIALAEGCYFDVNRAMAISDFFSHRLTHGADPWYGKPFNLLDYQWDDIIAPIYGWYTAEHLRRYVSAFVFIAKKNGKTALAAALALVELHFARGAHVYIIANAERQAMDLYRESAGMVERSPKLLKNLKVNRSTGRIIKRDDKGVIATMTKGVAASEGKNANALILEEFHAWKERKLYESLLYAGSAKLNPMTFIITTAGDDVNGICYEEYERAKQILAGDDLQIDHLPVVYEAPADSSYDDIEAWKLANPGFGTVLPLRNIESQIKAAKGRPSKIATIKRYKLNIWTKEETAWLDAQVWANLPLLNDESEAEGVLWGGLDLARTRDFAALILLFSSEDGIDIVPRIYCPRDIILDKEDEDKIPLQSWVDNEFVIATDGGEIDQDRIYQDILEANDTWRFAEVGYDPYNAGRLAKDVRENGIVMTAVPQTMPFMGHPSAEFERLLSKGRIRHTHNPCMKWMIANAVTISDNNDNVRPSKKKSNKRIDGLVATIIALQRALSPDAEQAVSDTPYEWI